MPALQLLDPSGNPTGIFFELFPGQQIAMTGTAVPASGFVQNQAVRVTNKTNGDIHVRADGTAAAATGAAMVVLQDTTEFVVVQHSGGTISLIGAGTSGFVYLMPLQTG
jgi:hypothetical protein